MTIPTCFLKITLHRYLKSTKEKLPTITRVSKKLQRLPSKHLKHDLLPKRRKREQRKPLRELKKLLNLKVKLKLLLLRKVLLRMPFYSMRLLMPTDSELETNLLFQYSEASSVNLH